MSTATSDLTAPPCADDEGPELVECEWCWQMVDEDELYECAGSVPSLPLLHCGDCETGCGPCRDESAREWAAEHGRCGGGGE